MRDAVAASLYVLLVGLAWEAVILLDAPAVLGAAALALPLAWRAACHG